MVSGPGGFAGDFVAALAGDFAAHGAEAICALRERNPNAYLRLCASVLRHKAAARDPLEDLTDAQLAARVATIGARLADAGERPRDVDGRETPGLDPGAAMTKETGRRPPPYPSTRASQASSSSTATPRSRALASFDPAPGPATR